MCIRDRIGPCYVGRGAVVESGSRIAASIIGDGAFVSGRVERSIVGDRAAIRGSVSNALVCEYALVEAGSVVARDPREREGCHVLGMGALVLPGSAILPYRKIGVFSEVLGCVNEDVGDFVSHSLGEERTLSLEDALSEFRKRIWRFEKRTISDYEVELLERLYSKRSSRF